MSRLTETAQRLADYVASHICDCRVVYAAEFSMQADELAAHIVPVETRITVVSRGRVQAVHVFELCFSRFVADDSDAPELVDAVTGGMEGLADETFTGNEAVVGVEADQVYSVSNLRNRKVFLSVWTVSVRDFGIGGGDGT